MDMKIEFRLCLCLCLYDAQGRGSWMSQVMQAAMLSNSVQTHRGSCCRSAERQRQIIGQSHGHKKLVKMEDAGDDG